MGLPPEPKGGVVSRIGDVPIKVVYLVGAVVATVAAVLLVFVMFSGDVPEEPAVEEVVPVVPVPSASGSVSGSPTATGTTAGAALPAVPAKRAFPRLGGKAAVPQTVVASIPEPGKAYWADLKTFAAKVRPL
ncbi:hypothetical protein [Nonomuraea ceibae]|uniref:hypothetical protein n=1 Tax=Nonomuraea ceibae TaxID=1935170 RepID=UPI001C5D0A67|nr:hypothetical protein [Nonomuraea ceibae]